MPAPSSIKKDGLAVTAHAGDSAVLLAFDVDDDKRDDLAGFSIECTTPSKEQYQSRQYFLKNLLSFKELTSGKKIVSESSDKAPFQTFHWIHFPGGRPGVYKYSVHASYFDGNGKPKPKQKVTVQADLSYKVFSKLELGFTRGYVSSQAYADKFKNNKNILPKTKSLSFDTSKNGDVYKWLGAHATRMIFYFLKECEDDPSLYLDVFSYDLSEPEIIRRLVKLAPRLRIFQDDSVTTEKKDGKRVRAGHGISDSIETKAIKKLASAGAKVRRGHFGRFAHNKVMIQKKNGVAVKVLTGSANFSMRGLYVQANSVLVFNDVTVAGLYEKAFEKAFSDEAGFRSSHIASKWHDVIKSGLPKLSISFAPHKKEFNANEKSTLIKVDDAINSAKNSVLFAVMMTSGAGPIIPSLENLRTKNSILSFGITQQKGGNFKLSRPGMDDNAAVAHFDYLSEKEVTRPFKAEWNGGQGQVIHHKFVVCDFNDEDPVVFCGSSNLAEGGETCNGDNLMAISDRKVATLYAIEAIRLFDHYRFRNLHENSTSGKPLTLKSTDDWTNPYYDVGNIKRLERTRLIANAF